MFGCGIPIFFQEVATGQYLGSGGLTMIGQLVPMLQGTYHNFNNTHLYCVHLIQIVDIPTAL